MTGPGRNVLVLHWANSFQRHRPTLQAHLRVFEASRCRHRVTYLNAREGVPARLVRRAFDVVVLHTTLLNQRWTPWLPWLRDRLAWLADFDGVTVALPQDEFSFSETLDDWLADLNVDVIGSTFGKEAWPVLYPRMHTRARLVTCWPGYVDLATAARRVRECHPARERPLDVVYRSFDLPYWLGSHGQLKTRLPYVVSEAAGRLGYRCDISNDAKDAIFGERWFDFLASGRATIGVESGTGVLDRRGEIRAAIQAMLRERPEMTFAEVSRRLPPGWDRHRFLTVGPRHFEAMTTRTCQVLVEGEYAGLLQPNVHYLPLKADFSNVEAVLESLRDHDRLDAITARAYDDFCRSERFTYAGMAATLDEAIGQVDSRAQRPNRLLTGVGLRLASAWGRLGLVGSRFYPGVVFAQECCRTPGLLGLGIALLRRHDSLVACGKELLRFAWFLRAARLGLVCHVAFDPGRGVVRWISQPAGPNDWDAVEVAIRQRRVTRLVWDYAALYAKGHALFRTGLNFHDFGDCAFPLVATEAARRPERFLALLRSVFPTSGPATPVRSEAA